MNMKDMIQRMTDIENETQKLNESVQEAHMAPPVSQGSPVSMNVSLNASGKENVADLVDMMKNAGLGDAKPMDAKMMPMRMDMERLRDIVDEPEMDSPCGAGADNRPEEAYMDTEELLSGGDDMHAEKDPADIRVKDPSAYENADEEIEEWDYEPDEKFGDHNQMINDLSGGINKKKKMYKASQRGDNAMAVESIKEELYKALAEKKANEGVGGAVVGAAAGDSLLGKLAGAFVGHKVQKSLNKSEKNIKKIAKALTRSGIDVDIDEAAKPDFLDLDGDGNKKEPMKKAAKEKGSKPKKGKVPPQFQKKK